jgi:DNA-binding CsgD family transcriptional regulator
MWQQPDSALKVMLEFAGSEAADSMDAFEGHYCQVLVAELLFKNDYGQSNRKDLLKAVHYFDSIVGMDGADTRGKADARGVSVQRRDAFLAARAHYINGVGYYERDSLIEACGEYLNALRMMEGHFEEKVLAGHKARFMALTYNRLVELFSAQYMQEPAIYCGKQSLAYDKKAQSSPDKIANTYFFIAKQYGKLEEADSAAYYYKMALETHPDRKTLVYRDAVCLLALSEFRTHQDTLASLDSLKSMMLQAANETEMLTRFMTIGSIYHDIGQYDSAKVYLEPVVEKYPKGANTAAIYLRDITLKEGDTVKANQYALILAEKGATAANNQARASQLNDLFQNYLQEKQEKALALERLKAQRRNLWIGGMVALLAIVGLAVAIVTRRSHRKRLAAQEAEAQRRLDEASQRLSEASQRHDAAERELQTKVEQATLHTKEVLQQRAMTLYHGKEKDKLQRILAEFDGAYPKTYERMMAAYPDLSMQEYELCVLGYFDFRAKEIAQLMDLQEGTVYRYRSTIRKKTGADDLEALMGRFLD